jgi:hypothetical protein
MRSPSSNWIAEIIALSVAAASTHCRQINTRVSFSECVQCWPSGSGRVTGQPDTTPKSAYFRIGHHPPRTPKIGASRGWKRALACSRQLLFGRPKKT